MVEDIIKTQGSVMSPRVRRFMINQEDEKGGYLQGRQARLNYSPPHVSSVRRILTRREMKGRIIQEDYEFDLCKLLKVGGREYCRDLTLRNKLYEYCTLIFNQWPVKLKGGVDWKYVYLIDGTIYSDGESFKVDGIGRVFATPENQKQRVEANIFPLRDSRNIAVYQVGNEYNQVLKAAGYIYQPEKDLKLFEVL